MHTIMGSLGIDGQLFVFIAMFLGGASALLGFNHSIANEVPEYREDIIKDTWLSVVVATALAAIAVGAFGCSHIVTIGLAVVGGIFIPEMCVLVRYAHKITPHSDTDGDRPMPYAIQFWTHSDEA